MTHVLHNRVRTRHPQVFFTAAGGPGVIQVHVPESLTTPSDDLRSYHINSDKIKRVLGYAPKYTIEDAITAVALISK